LQKILIIYSSVGKIDQIAKGIAAGLQKNGYQVTLQDTGKTDRPISFHSYDLVMVGSPTLGFFKGKIADDLSPFLKNCKRTGGQETVAFVTPRLFGTTKALKKVMGEMEKLGCIVKDFTSIKNYNQAVEFGESVE